MRSRSTSPREGRSSIAPETRELEQYAEDFRYVLAIVHDEHAGGGY